MTRSTWRSSQARTAQEDLINFKRKITRSAITQYFFNSITILRS